MSIKPLHDHLNLTEVEAQVERLVSSLHAEWADRAAAPIIDIASSVEAEAFRAWARPGAPRSIAEVVSDAERIFARRVRMDHPRFFGFIPSPDSPLSAKRRPFGQ